MVSLTLSLIKANVRYYAEFYATLFGFFAL